MIELSLEDLIIWVLAISFLLIAALRMLSKFRRDHNRKRQRKSVFYCNVCVQYIPGESEKKVVTCPSCDRAVPRGRKRNLG